MGMVHCRECGKKISDSAAKCPDCGAPTEVQTSSSKKKFTGSTGWLVFWILIFWPIAIFYYVSRRE